MTIGVVVKSPEGIVLAADSILTVTDKETNKVLDLYRHSKKVQQIADYPIGVITAGTANIGDRSLESYIIEYSNVLNRRRKRYPVKGIAEFLYKRLDDLFKKEDIKDAIEIICAGFSPNDVMPDVYVLQVPNGPPVRFFYKDGYHTFNFYPVGVGERWIHRWYFGYDDDIFDILGKYGPLEDKLEEIRKDLTENRLPIPIPAMPLQDTIDFAVFLINVAIGSSRFSIGPATCGGEIDLVAITKKEGFIPLKVKRLEYKAEYGSFA